MSKDHLAQKSQKIESKKDSASFIQQIPLLGPRVGVFLELFKGTRARKPSQE